MAALGELEPGALLGERFEIAGVLGRGGMATVYLARDRVRDAKVALKVLHPHLASDEGSRARLRRELLAAQHIRHPRALVASELFELDGALALSMPLHPGHALAEDLSARGPMDAEQLWRLGADLAGALAEAHRAGVVHRDLSPGNVLIDRDRRGVLTDFGLARIGEAGSRTATTALGTAGYSAPEVLEGQKAGPAADLYGLGAVLYLAATGRAPFEAATPLAVMKRQAEGAFTPLAELRPDLPPALRAQIEALLARDPAARPESARAVADAMSAKEATKTKTFDKTRPSVPSIPPQLPAGGHRVVLVEPQERRLKRQQRKRHLRRARQAGLEGLIEGIAANVEPAVRSFLGLPPGREPEELLVEAVAAEARLPAEALRRPEALESGRFRLVDGVSQEVAERLAEAAREAGYSATVHGEGRRDTRPWTLLGAAAVLLAVAGGAPALLTTLFSAVGMSAPIGPAVVLGAGLLALVLLGLAVSGILAGARGLPLAFPNDLRPLLTPAHQARLAAEQPAPVAPPDPVTALVQRTAERLGALEAAIAARADALPAPAVEDLRRTLGELRARGRAVEAALRALSAELAGRDAGAEEASAARVQARLERLRAHARAGEAVDSAELAALERALAAHQATLAAIEQDEQRLTRLEATLLEIGAAAEHARRVLLDQPEPARSLDGLLGRLATESAHARDAEAEVQDARRRAAAAARQGAGGG